MDTEKPIEELTQISPGVVIVPEAPGPELGAPTQPVRLDLACGQRCKEGFEGLDLYAPAARKVDLLKFPWPIESDSVDELHIAFADLLDELSNQYLIGYQSSNSKRDDAWRKIKVEVDGHHEVRARQGYRALAGKP
jgi:hypothetical protein